LRKTIVLLILVVIFYLAFWVDKEGILKNPKPTFNDPMRSPIELEVDGKLYKVFWEKIKKDADISLIPNFKEKLSSPEIIENYACSVLTNAGFYTKENSPIGLFIANGDLLSPETKNFLFNAFVTLDGSSKIAKLAPQGQNAFQTGPLLIFEGKIQNLNLTSDKNARRVIAATTDANELILAVLYDKESALQGPKLANLSNLIKTLSDKEKLGIKTAINLDGGSASTFYTKDLNLPEIANVGSFLCIN